MKHLSKALHLNADRIRLARSFMAIADRPLSVWVVVRPHRSNDGSWPSPTQTRYSCVRAWSLRRQIENVTVNCALWLLTAHRFDKCSQARDRYGWKELPNSWSISRRGRRFVCSMWHGFIFVRAKRLRHQKYHYPKFCCSFGLCGVSPYNTNQLL